MRPVVDRGTKVR